MDLVPRPPSLPCRLWLHPLRMSLGFGNATTDYTAPFGSEQAAIATHLKVSNSTVRHQLCTAEVRRRGRGATSRITSVVVSSPAHVYVAGHACLCLRCHVVWSGPCA